MTQQSMEKYAGFELHKISGFRDLESTVVDVQIKGNLGSAEIPGGDNWLFEFKVNNCPFRGYVTSVGPYYSAVEVVFERHEEWGLGKNVTGIYGDLGGAAIKVFSAVISAVYTIIYDRMDTLPEYIIFLGEEEKRQRLYTKMAMFFSRIFRGQWEVVDHDDPSLPKQLDDEEILLRRVQ